MNLLLKVCFLLSIFLSSDALADNVVRVAAASDLRYAMAELTEYYQRQSGQQVNVTYGSSGQLATQIIHGAPYQIFFSANPQYIDELIKVKVNQGPRVHYATGYLVLFARNESTLQVDKELLGLKEYIQTKQLRRIAIANPRHAPYGQLAKKILQKKGIWDDAKEKLLLGDSATQTMQFTMTTNVDAGFVPYAFMTQSIISDAGRFVILEGELHQEVIMTKRANKATERFLQFIQSEPASEIFARHGFKTVATT